MHLPIAQAQELLSQSTKRFIEVFQHGTLTIELYKPDRIDHQMPHARDEVYIIVSGTGTFKNGDQLITFVPHDFLFVAAGVDHQFIDFTDDFYTWVLFYGPIGGE